MLNQFRFIEEDDLAKQLSLLNQSGKTLVTEELEYLGGPLSSEKLAIGDRFYSVTSHGFLHIFRVEMARATEPKTESILDKPIHALGLSVRVKNILKGETSIETIGDLVNTPLVKLKKAWGLGRKGIKEIATALATFGLSQKEK